MAAVAHARAFRPKLSLRSGLWLETETRCSSPPGGSGVVSPEKGGTLNAVDTLAITLLVALLVINRLVR
jgi:hypothetical protein